MTVVVPAAEISSMRRSLRSASLSDKVSSTWSSEKPGSPAGAISTVSDCESGSAEPGQGEGGPDVLFIGGGRLQRPVAREADGGQRIETAKAHFAVEHQAAAIEMAGAIGHRIDGKRRVGTDGEDFLDVAIAEVRIGLEHQRDGARHHRRGEGGAGHIGGVGGAVGVAIGGQQADARRREQHIGARARKERRFAVGVMGAHGDAEAGVGEIVEVGIVADIPALDEQLAIAGGKHHRGAEPAAAERGGGLDAGGDRGEIGPRRNVGEGGGEAPAVVGDVIGGLVRQDRADLVDREAVAIAEIGCGDRRVGAAPMVPKLLAAEPAMTPATSVP